MMLKSILKLFNIQKNEFKVIPEKEIYILTSLSTFPGGSKSENDTHWTCGQKFVAYVDCETDKLYRIKDTVSWLREDKKEHPFEFEPMTIYKVKV